MTTRPMTAADYAAAGIDPPPGFCEPPARRGFWMTPDGRYMSENPRPGFTIWFGPETERPARCDECGDETGQCGCRQ